MPGHDVGNILGNISLSYPDVEIKVMPFRFGVLNIPKSFLVFGSLCSEKRSLWELFCGHVQVLEEM